MKWHELSATNCPIARSLSIFGDRWTLLIIRNAFMRTSRFDDFQKQLGITRHLLTTRLNHLVENEIFKKEIYLQAPKRYEYKLTEKGLALYPLIIAMGNWGNTWQNSAKEFQELHYVHKTCGKITQAKLTCNCCGEELHATKMMPVFVDANTSQRPE